MINYEGKLDVCRSQTTLSWESGFRRNSHLFHFTLLSLKYLQVKFDWKEWSIISNLEEKETSKGDDSEGQPPPSKKGGRQGQSFVNGALYTLRANSTDISPYGLLLTPTSLSLTLFPPSVWLVSTAASLPLSSEEYMTLGCCPNLSDLKHRAI